MGRLNSNGPSKTDWKMAPANLIINPEKFMTEEVYHNGKLNGTVRLYNKNGNLAYIDTYQDGVKLSRVKTLQSPLKFQDR